MKSAKKITGIILLLILFVAGIIPCVNKIKAVRMKNDYSSIYKNEKYQKPVFVQGITVFPQKYSCGYAVIQMMAQWNNDTALTEEALFAEHEKIVTSTGRAFAAEMNRKFPQYKTQQYKYLKNTELIDKVYESLAAGIPVPFEWAAKKEDEWTLHYSIITGLDLPADKIIIANPYGYVEEISIEEFLSRTSFDAYEKMPLFIKLGFAYGVFEKNDLFILTQTRDSLSVQ